MRTLTTLPKTPPCPTVVALGCFDGVHRGHASILMETVKIARERSLLSAVFTFDRPPRNFFSPDVAKPITDLDEKKRLMRKAHTDLLVCIPFTSEIASLSPREFFLSILKERLGAMHLVCGFNYTFGKGGSGNAKLLASLCEEFGIGLTVLPPVLYQGIPVSSSRIRTALEEGDLTLANALLGRPFALCAKVTEGQKLARRLGFPTVNQALRHTDLLPAFGVYVSRVRIGYSCHYGVTNVGCRPTVGGTLPFAETHILDFDGDLYGKTLRIELLHFLRPEKPFPSVECLARQIEKDVSEAKAYWKQ